MIKIVEAQHVSGTQIRFRFSDGSTGVHDFAWFTQVGTSMTDPLRDPEFFKRFFVEFGALAWPNGLDLSAASLQRRMRDEGSLAAGAEAA